MQTVVSEFLDRPVFKLLSEVAEQTGVRAFVIGGYVRDRFLGRECNDIDVVVEGSGIDFATAVGEKTGKYVSYFKNFGTAMLHYGGDEIEFVGARKESYRRESRKPIVENGTLEDDQLRRDFTINAMALSLQKEDFGALVDPFGGIRDLAAGIIRTPLDPDTTYSDDPLRMLRAVRFASKLSTPEHGFTIVPESMASMRRMADRLGILSRERIADELNKMMMTPRPSMAFRLMDEAGLLPHILPQLLELKGVETVEGRGHKDNFEHTLAVLDNIASRERNPASGEEEPETPHPLGSAADRELWLRWAALLHDIGKPASKRYDPAIGWTFHGHEVIGSRMVPKIFNDLKLPVEAAKYVRKLVWLHLRPIALVDEEVTDSAVRRLLFDAGDDIDDLMALCNADITSKNPVKVAKVKANFELVARKLVEVEAKDAIRNFKNPITGEYVMELYGIGPCNKIGQIKEMVKEAILDGVIGNNFEEADAFMRAHAPELGLQEQK
ncbi:MAG: HD domain-containing protein [Bacteroidales bacterium]|nr:HD domain-containing protein [Bacteroidales bacterium]